MRSSIGSSTDLMGKLKEYNRRAKVLKKFNPFESKVCPPRLEVNVYTGCAYNCKYCYARAYIRDFYIPRPKADFEKKLKREAQRAIEMGLDKLPVSISNSCEPFQPLEDKYKHTLSAIKFLTENRFYSILITKNPSKLLEREYVDSMDSKRTFIEVTITSLNSRFFEPNAPLAEERIKAISELIKLGFTVAVRFDPIIPRCGEIPGPSPSEIEEIMEKLHQANVNYVIAKCLRLVGATRKAYPEFYHALKPYYQTHGVWRKNRYELRREVKQKLHAPVYQACSRRGILYSTCLDDVKFPNSVMCDRSSQYFCNF